ncbi:TrgA family protein [Tabrizicola oligotrophica]|uniref:TrgA family protein n=1 Tax=Tabrizicola oligotrophica TaxID=2710650 RepID=A0A6M0QVA4_9RHOB|nr:TrgA family protein [Tabrizicola oligotrophica]NEY91337.1 TrgA family protein [Tabrizicola oligotrophica]
MPTAPKLTAAVIFALVAAIAAHLFIPALPEGTQVKLFREISAAIGFLCGWLIMGRMTGRGMVEAINRGLVTSVSILFWCLLVFSIYFMIRKSTRMMYDGPMEAVLGIFEMMLEFGMLLKSPATPVALAAGGVLGGMLTEAASRRWS